MARVDPGEVTRLDRLARLGYLARAVVYILLGYIALSARPRAGDGQDAVFDMLQEVPGGNVALALLVLGLVCYGLYKLASSAFDLENHGNKPKAVAVRIGLAAGAIAYLAMAWTASRFASDPGRSAGQDGGGQSQEMAGGLLAMPLGWVLLALVGLAFLAAAVFQAVNAVNGQFMKRISPAAPEATNVIGRIGFAGRTVVFGLVGLSLLRSAWYVRTSEIRDLGGVLSELRGTEWLYLVVAAGLLLFGVFSLILARYRIVPRVDVMDAARGHLTPRALRR